MSIANFMAVQIRGGADKVVEPGVLTRGAMDLSAPTSVQY